MRIVSTWNKDRCAGKSDLPVLDRITNDARDRFWMIGDQAIRKTAKGMIGGVF
jgi:hypothetical protein